MYTCVLVNFTLHVVPLYTSTNLNERSEQKECLWVRVVEFFLLQHNLNTNNNYRATRHSVITIHELAGQSHCSQSISTVKK